MHHLHLVYAPLMETLSDKDMAEFLQRTLKHMPDVNSIPEDMTRAKIELLQKTIATKLFKSDGKNITEVSWLVQFILWTNIEF